MPDKMPSPWSEEFHTLNTTKKIGGDEIQHGIISKIKGMEESKLFRKTMIDDGRMADELAAKICGEEMTPVLMSAKAAEWLNNQGYLDKNIDIKLIQKFKDMTVAKALVLQKKWAERYKEEDALREKRELEQKRRSSPAAAVADFQRKEREEEQRRKSVAAAKASAKARQGGKDRM